MNDEKEPHSSPRIKLDLPEALEDRFIERAKIIGYSANWFQDSLLDAVSDDGTPRRASDLTLLPHIVFMAALKRNSLVMFWGVDSTRV